MSSLAFVIAFLFIVVILGIIFGGKNQTQVETNKANILLIRRHYSSDYWGYTFSVNFVNCFGIFYFHGVYGNIVFFVWPILLFLLMPIHNWYYSRLLEKAKLKEQALTK